MKQQQGTSCQKFPSFLRTSSKSPPPLILALPKKKPSNYSPGGLKSTQCLSHTVCAQCVVTTATPPDTTYRLTASLFLVLHAHSAVLCTPPSFVSLRSLCLMHTGKPTGVAVPQCIIWFQTQLILMTCQICYHSHLRDHCPPPPRV